MSLVTILFGVITLVLLVVVLGQVYRNSKRQQGDKATTQPEKEARARIVEKVEMPELPQPVATVDADDDLSQSGMVSIQGEIDRCIAAERWDEAISWAQHAVESRPERNDLKVKLAEIYHHAGDREGFMELFEELKGKLGEDHDLRRQLISMARKTMPGHDEPPVQPETGDKSA